MRLGLFRVFAVVLFITSTCTLIQADSNNAFYSKESYLQRDIRAAKRKFLVGGKRRIVASTGIPTIANAPATPSATPTKANAASHHKMSLRNLIINIVADLCPHGMMPLAFGFARGGPSGAVPAMLMLLAFSAMSGYTMLSLAKLASSTKSKSIGEVWGKLISKKTEWVVDLAVLLLCFGCCVFYSAFIGDIFSAVASALGASGILAARWVVLLSISAFILLPLCMLEDMSSLQFSSMVGVFGIVYTVGFILLRFFDGTYVEGSPMLDFVDAKMLPEWQENGINLWRVNTGTIVLANMLCLAFLSHYNAVNYYLELEDRNEKRYTTAISAGFGIAACVFLTMLFTGYLLFGSSAQPLLLNNFPKTKDNLATVARIATGAAITFAYPLMFAGLKSSLFSLILYFTTSAEEVRKFGKKKVKDMSKTVQLSAILTALAIITSIAFKCGEEDVGLILGLVGSVLGCFAAYILPGMLRLVQMRERKQLGLTNKLSDVLVNHGLIALGSIFGALGVWITLKTEVEKHAAHTYY